MGNGQAGSASSKDYFTKIWNSSFIRIICYAFLCQFTMAITNTVLPLYVINGLGMSAADSGLLGTFFTIGSVCCRFFAGYITDRFGRRTTLMLGGTIVGLSLFFLGFSRTMVMLLVFKTVQGIGNALNSTASNATASEVLPRDKVGQGIGYYSLHQNITGALAPTLCLALMGIGAASSGSQNYQLPLVIGGFMGIAAALVGGSLNYEKKIREIDPSFHREKPQGVHISDFIEIRALVPALMMMFTSFASGAGTYMIVFATQYQFKTVGIYYIIDAIVGVSVRFAFGSKFDALKPRNVALIAIALNVTSYLLMGFTLSEWAFVLSAFLFGAFNAMLAPTFNAMAMKMVPESRSGAASSTYWLGFDIGMVIGMTVFGAIIDAAGFKGAFLTAGGFMVIFAILVAILLRKTVPLREMTNPEE